MVVNRIMRIIGLILLTLFAAAAQDNAGLNFLANHTDFKNIRSMLPDYAKQQALELLNKRKAGVAQWRAADVTARKQYVRDHMLKALGGFPERTPLNARVAGVVEHSDYRIEKIIFESQPRFYVTANLYLPKNGRPPYPAILFPLGHEEGAKAHGTWQQLLVTFARNGYVALAWDTIGQGERVQLYDEDFQASKVIRSTTEHTLIGTQTLLVGDPLARYTIWDGIRALDYLVSRSEVDPKRVGLTGNSGGGTHTAYIAALDDRIQVAAPSCFLTTWPRLLETIGPQDAEQNIPPWFADGLDHADFVHAFAPRPYLILSAIRDFFSITGARETYQEARRAYDLLGSADKLSMTEADDGHGYTKPRRLAAYRWFDKWLKGSEQSWPELEVTPAAEQDLFCTATGQVATSLGGETVFSLNQKRARSLKRETASVEQVRRLTGYEKPDGTVVVRPFGTLARSGYRIEKLVYESDPGVIVPALLFIPEGTGRRPGVLYVHGRGKTAAVSEIESLVRSGKVVLAVDIRGMGETRGLSDSNGSDWPRYFGDFESAMTLLLSGKTLVGMRARDISRGIDVLAGREEVDPNRIYGAAVEGAGVSLLHAAIMDERIRRIVLDRTLISYQSVVDHRIHRGVFEDVIPGVLKHYDLPHLARLAGSREVRLVDPLNPVGQKVAIESARAQYGTAKVLRRGVNEMAATVYGFAESR
jgi:cephalosporin-C deacetylase-like acetyl esterase